MNAQTKIEPASLHAAMAAAFAEIEGATKSANNPHFRTKYADLSAVIEAIKPALIKNALFFTQRPQPSEGGVTIETVIGHASGEELSLGSLFVPANKNDAQAYGSALTYARRYALVTAFGVPVEDDDGNGAVQGQSRRTVSPEPAVKPLDEHDWARITQLVEATKSNVPNLLKAIGSQASTLADLTRPEFDKAIAALEAKLAKLVAEETNAKAKEPA